MPVASPVVGEASWFCVPVSVVIREAIAKGSGGDVRVAAVFGELNFCLFGDVHNFVTFIAHLRKHPYDVIRVGFDGVGEVEASSSSLGSGDNKKVRKSVAVYAQERFGSLGLPLVSHSLTTPAGDHVES